MVNVIYSHVKFSITRIIIFNMYLLKIKTNKQLEFVFVLYRTLQHCKLIEDIKCGITALNFISIIIKE